MEKIFFEDLPSTNTPINATNLNTIQDNVERALENTGGAGNLKIALGLDQDTYDSTATYSVGDLVIHDNIIYECNTDIDTAEEWDETKWDVVPIIDKTTNPAFMKKDTKNIMTVGKSTNQSPLIASTYTKVEYDKYVKVGDKLTMENNGIKIGEGVKKVLVSGRLLFLLGGNVTSTRYFRIVKNSVDTTISWSPLNPQAGTGHHEISLPPVLCEVQPGDVIYGLYFTASSSDSLYSVALDSSTIGTCGFLTVEVVEYE